MATHPPATEGEGGAVSLEEVIEEIVRRVVREELQRALSGTLARPISAPSTGRLTPQEVMTIGVDEWVSVRTLAEATGNAVGMIYNALYDKQDPMSCARKGRAIRVRLADWRAWWERRTTTIQPGSPARAPRRKRST